MFMERAGNKSTPLAVTVSLDIMVIVVKNVSFFFRTPQLQPKAMGFRDI